MWSLKYHSSSLVGRGSKTPAYDLLKTQTSVNRSQDAHKSQTVPHSLCVDPASPFSLDARGPDFSHSTLCFCPVSKSSTPGQS